MIGNLTVVMTLPIESAVVEATLGEQLQYLGIEPKSVTVIGVGAPGHAAKWAGRAIPLRTSRPPFTGIEAAWRGAMDMRRSGSRTLYVRDDWAAFGVWLLRLIVPGSTQVIYDKRGSASDEYALKSRSRLRSRLIRTVESLGSRVADRCMYVSEALRVRHPEGPGVAAVVVPNCFTPDPEGSHASPSLATVAWVSGGDAWQLVERHVEILEGLAELGFHTKIFTRDRGLLSRSGDLRTSVVSLPREDVLLELKSCDVCLVLREPNKASLVASPIKLAEALGSGCAVVVTPSTSEAVPQLLEKGLALVLDDDTDDVSRIARFASVIHESGADGRAARMRLAEDVLSWRRYDRELRNFFLDQD